MLQQGLSKNGSGARVIDWIKDSFLHPFIPHNRSFAMVQRNPKQHVPGGGVSTHTWLSGEGGVCLWVPLGSPVDFGANFGASSLALVPLPDPLGAGAG